MKIDVNLITDTLENGKGWYLLDNQKCEITESNYQSYMEKFGKLTNSDNSGTKILRVEDRGVSREQIEQHGIVRVEKNKEQYKPFMSNTELEFHTDLCDVTFLMCINAAEVGGISKVVSSKEVYNYLKKYHKSDLDIIENTKYQVHHQTPLKPDGKNYLIEIPIFTFQDGYFASYLLRTYILVTNEKLKLGLTQDQINALNLVEEISKKLSTEIALKPGNILILNNHTSYHARTEFKDIENKRLLLRGWLSGNSSRPLNNKYKGLYGDSLGASEFRGGYIAV